jgi:hypothetical protein
VDDDSVRSRMQQLSEALTKGLALFAALLGVLAARDGGIGRLFANASAYVLTALGFVVLSIMLGFVAWLLTTLPGPVHRRAWFALLLASILLIGMSFATISRAAVIADRNLERPTLAAEYDGTMVELSAAIHLLRSTDFMRTTVYGYPSSGGRRDLLFNSTTGPDSQGLASISGAFVVEQVDYEVIEVRAFRGPDDPGCERPTDDGQMAAERGPAACASLWLEPLVELRPVAGEP